MFYLSSWGVQGNQKLSQSFKTPARFCTTPFSWYILLFYFYLNIIYIYILCIFILYIYLKMIMWFIVRCRFTDWNTVCFNEETCYLRGSCLVQQKFVYAVKVLFLLCLSKLLRILWRARPSIFSYYLAVLCWPVIFHNTENMLPIIWYFTIYSPEQSSLITQIA